MEKENHSVSLSGNGKEGMEFLSENEVDIVITDIIMSEQEGMQTISQVQSQHPGTKIIAMSGGGRIVPEEYLQTAERFGVNATLKKPFRSSNLLEAVEHCLAD